MHRCRLISVVLIASLLFAGLACRKTEERTIADEVREVPIFVQYKFHWDTDDREPLSDEFPLDGAHGKITLRLEKLVSEVQLTLTPESGWQRQDVSGEYIVLSKQSVPSNIDLFFTSSDNGYATEISVSQSSSK